MEIKELQLAKYITTAIPFVLIALGGSLWPFTWWDMYASGEYRPSSEVKRLELRVLDSAGQQHILHPMDLYTLDDDTSNQTPGHRLMQTAITGTAEQQKIYRPYLIKQIELVTDANVEQIEAWQYVWQVDFEQHPPINLEQPIQTVLIDRFKPSPQPLESSIR
ncbi:MAG: hypothetical protein AAF151_21890 [Cyanobacteria bacterium J06656_5]